MDNPHLLPISLLVFLPALGALVLAFFPKDRTTALKASCIAVTVAVFLLAAWLAIPRGEGSSLRFALGTPEMQSVVNYGWISSFNIQYFLGFDGISFPLVLLTGLTTMLAAVSSWTIDRHVKAYCILLLLLETGMIGVFLALDFFLFYVFWEVMLLPMYFLIGVWGGPRREYAAIKFFLFTLVGSVAILIAMLMLYFGSDLRKLTPAQLIASHVVDARLPAAEQQAAAQRVIAATTPQHTFNILALKEIGQMPDSAFNEPILGGYSIAWWSFLLLFIGFAVKVPIVPLHTWLPDAHVEAPTPISMILAGVLLKMGGYGILRICYPICPAGGYDLAYLVCALGALSMVYGAFAALAQRDFKRLVAYSSVSHMGYVVLGLGVWSATAGFNYDWRYWAEGVNGAMFQMIAHGISSAGMFFMVGVLYERVHHRNLDEFGGIFNRMPVYSGLSFVLFFAALGLPGLCGFIGEILVTLSAWNYSRLLAIIAASVVILTAAYILWTLQRVYLGAEYRGPHGDRLTPLTARELFVATPLVALAIILGVYPQALLSYITPTVNRSIESLANWTQNDRPVGTAYRVIDTINYTPVATSPAAPPETASK